MERKFSRKRLYKFTWLVIAIVSLLSGYFSIYYYLQSTEILHKAEDSFKLSNEIAKDRSARCNSLFGNNPKDAKDINFMRCYDDVFTFQKSSFAAYKSDLISSSNLLRKAIFLLIIAIGSPVAYLIGILRYRQRFSLR
jgi:hypothetical protein